MTQHEIIRIAKAVYGEHTTWHGIQLQRLERLAQMVAEVEREECATVCFVVGYEINAMGDAEAKPTAVVEKCAAAIRERGKA